MTPSQTLLGYFDESGDPRDPQHEAVSIAGYVAPAHAWGGFCTAWSATLDEFNLPYLHMRELTKRVGEFKTWTKDDPNVEVRVASLLGRLATVIGAAALKGFGAVIVLEDLRRFNRETGIELDPKALAIYGCALEIRHRFRTNEIELVLDRMDRAPALIRTATQYGATDYYYPFMRNFPRFRVLARGGLQGSRSSSALQAADFLAWELRKNFELKRGWFESDHPPLDSLELGDSLFQWYLRDRIVHGLKTGGTSFTLRTDLMRRSLSALFDATTVDGMIWEYSILSQAHLARGGAW